MGTPSSQSEVVRLITALLESKTALLQKEARLTGTAGGERLTCCMMSRYLLASTSTPCAVLSYMLGQAVLGYQGARSLVLRADMALCLNDKQVCSFLAECQLYAEMGRSSLVGGFPVWST